MKSRRRRSSGTRQAFASQLNMREAPPDARVLVLLRGALVRRRLARSGSSAAGSSSSASTAAGFALRVFGFFSTGSPRSQVTVPPASSIFSLAVFEKPCAETESAFESSPTPSTLTSTETLRISRFALSVSGVTSSPASKRSSRSRRLTGWLYVRNGPIGIASADVLPRSFPSRMSIGIWPPSKPAGSLCEPGAGLLALDPAAGVAAVARAHAAADALARLARLRRLQRVEVELVGHRQRPSRSSRRRHGDEVRDVAQLARELRRLLVLGGLADPAESERAQRALVRLGLTDRAAGLGDRPCHASLIGRPPPVLGRLGRLRLALGGGRDGLAGSLREPARPARRPRA